MAVTTNASPRPADTRTQITGSAASMAKLLKHRLRRAYGNGQRLIAQQLFGYSPGELEPVLRSLGLGAGDSILMHSGFRRVSGFRGTAADVIQSLLKVIDPNGHLLMMSIPYRGSSQHYAEREAMFDVRQSPSAVGLISEIFRRRPDVLRSLSPFHPVLAYGPLAAWLTADHEKCLYSCGKGSPFERFLSLDGKFLFFDAPFSSLTFMHYVEDHFRARLPVELYHREAATLRAKEASGREVTVRHFYFSEAARRRRHFAPLETALLRDGLMRTATVGNTRMSSVTARSVVDCATRLLDEGPGLYT